MDMKETLQQLKFWEGEFLAVTAWRDLPITRAAWLEKIGNKIATINAQLIFVC